MKTEIITERKEVLTFLEGLQSVKISDATRWIGDHSIRLDSSETLKFINDKVITQKHIKVYNYSEQKRICVELGLSDRDGLHINLR